MNKSGQRANRLELSERLLSGWEDIYRQASPPLMALRLVESEIELLRSMRTFDPILVDGLLDRYQRVAARLRDTSTSQEAATRVEISERALRRWEQMFSGGSFRRLSARLMEREAETLREMRLHDPARVDALIRRYLVLAADLRTPGARGRAANGKPQPSN